MIRKVIKTMIGVVLLWSCLLVHKEDLVALCCKVVVTLRSLIPSKVNILALTVTATT